MDRTLDRVSLIADDLGRLRRLGVEHYALERLCHSVDVLDAMLRPSAGELCAGGDSVLVALAQVDGERARLLQQMSVDTLT